MATTNYTGRSVDLLLSEEWSEKGEFRVTMTVGSTGEVCAGPQKVAQTFLIMLLTKQGSVISDPLFGVNFLSQIEQGVRNEFELTALFNVAASDIQGYLLRTQPDELPDDEKFDSARLISLESLSDSVKLVIEVVTQAGLDRSVIIPVGVPIK